MKRLEVSQFLEAGSSLPIIDVRSPDEFEQGHLPNALNLPLFSNEERAAVGTFYKQEGPLIAFKKGLDFIGPKLRSFVEYVERLGSAEVLVHCWRGGSRSQSIATLLETAGFQTSVLIGGYKAYRNVALEFFHQPLPLMVLTGYTGSRKTEVLHELKALGEQVVDFEGLAKHQGSAFGQQQNSEQPTAEHFQNLLYETFKTLDLNRRIWVEDESLKIGRVNLVPELYRQKNTSPCVFLDVSLETRIQNLVESYSSLPKSYLLAATDNIQKKLGSTESEDARKHINQGNAKEAARIILKYYDKRYAKSIADKQPQIKLYIQTHINHPQTLARQILEQL